MTRITRKKALWIALPATALLIVGAAVAGHTYEGGHRGHERMMHRISEALDLTAEQERKLRVVKEALLEGRQEFGRDRARTIDRVIAEVRKPEMDGERIMVLIEEQKSRIDGIAAGMLHPVMDFHKSLDDAQREKVANLLEAMRDWGWRRGRGGHG